MFNELASEDRLRLMRFVCAFAWADLEIGAEERNFVDRLVTAMGLSKSEADQVQVWMRHPPAPEDIDPQDVPFEHRELVLLAAKAMVATDGRITSGEGENLRLLEQILMGDDATEEWGPPPMTEELDMG